MFSSKNTLIKWQLPMTRMMYALYPLAIASIYYFGLRVLLLLAVVNAAGFLTEYLFVRKNNEPVSSAVFVTNFLFCLSLPPCLPLWMAVVGIVFGVTFGKMVFGGFGRNIFNPALVGRAFIYVSFPAQMTTQWSEPFKGLIKGFAAYASDTVSSATPIPLIKSGISAEWLDLFFGGVAGSLGETSAVLIILGGLYIVWKKAADYRIIVSGLAGLLFFQTLLWAFHIRSAMDPVSAVLSGGFLFGLFFFATEPVSAPKVALAKWIYGAFIGAMTVLIRVFSVWDEGMMFAVLLANMFAPLADHTIRQMRSKKKA